MGKDKKNTLLKKAFSQDFLEKQVTEENSPSIVHGRGILGSIPKDKEEVYTLLDTSKATPIKINDNTEAKTLTTMASTDKFADTVGKEKVKPTSFSIEGMDQNEIVKVIANSLKDRKDAMDILNRAKDSIYYKNF